VYLKASYIELIPHSWSYCTINDNNYHVAGGVNGSMLGSSQQMFGVEKLHSDEKE